MHPRENRKNQNYHFDETEKNAIGLFYKSFQSELQAVNSWTTVGQAKDIASGQTHLWLHYVVAVTNWVQGPKRPWIKQQACKLHIKSRTRPSFLTVNEVSELSRKDCSIFFFCL